MYLPLHSENVQMYVPQQSENVCTCASTIRKCTNVCTSTFAGLVQQLHPPIKLTHDITEILSKIEFKIPDHNI